MRCAGMLPTLHADLTSVLSPVVLPSRLHQLGSVTRLQSQLVYPNSYLR